MIPTPLIAALESFAVTFVMAFAAAVVKTGDYTTAGLIAAAGAALTATVRALQTTGRVPSPTAKRHRRHA